MEFCVKNPCKRHVVSVPAAHGDVSRGTGQVDIPCQNEAEISAAETPNIRRW